VIHGVRISGIMLRNVKQVSIENNTTQNNLLYRTIFFATL
jgi:hypothetical protein